MVAKEGRSAHRCQAFSGLFEWSGTFSGSASVTGAGAGWAMGKRVRSKSSVATTCSFRDSTTNATTTTAPKISKLFRMTTIPTFVCFYSLTIPNFSAIESPSWDPSPTEQDFVTPSEMMGQEADGQDGVVKVLGLLALKRTFRSRGAPR